MTLRLTKAQQKACVTLVREVLDGYATGVVGDIDGGWLESRAMELRLIEDCGSGDFDGYVLAPFLKRRRMVKS